MLEASFLSTLHQQTLNSLARFYVWTNTRPTLFRLQFRIGAGFNLDFRALILCVLFVPNHDRTEPDQRMYAKLKSCPYWVELVIRLCSSRISAQLIFLRDLNSVRTNLTNLSKCSFWKFKQCWFFYLYNKKYNRVIVLLFCQILKKLFGARVVKTFLGILIQSDCLTNFIIYYLQMLVVF